MNWTERRERFRAILAGGRCIHPGSVFDPISARIAEDLGFEVGMFAGSTASLTVLEPLASITSTSSSERNASSERTLTVIIKFDKDQRVFDFAYHTSRF